MKHRPFADAPFRDPGVKAVFDAYPAKLRPRLLRLRRLILDTAAETDGVGDLVETLKWSQPAYLTERPRSGSTIRIDALKGRDDGYAMFFHCQTRLVPTFRELYPDRFVFQGNRALVFSLAGEPPEDALKHCIALALTYHIRPRVL
ncbi:MAG: DUF1801 domain-containing protein [Kiloniellales bacterium]